MCPSCNDITANVHKTPSQLLLSLPGLEEGNSRAVNCAGHWSPSGTRKWLQLTASEAEALSLQPTRIETVSAVSAVLQQFGCICETLNKGLAKAYSNS